MPFPRLLHAPARADAPLLIRRDASGVRTIRRSAPDALVDLEERAAGDSEAGFPFTISTESRDLMGDIVVQAGRENVADRIPAQLDHSGEMRDLIGHWTDIKTRGARTTARLVLLERGLSPAADMIRALLEAGVRMASSIGFVSIKREWIREPDTDQGAITGIRFLRWKLLEASVVVVPANPEALSSAKRLLPAPARAELDEFVRAHARRPLTPMRAAAVAGSPSRNPAMNIAERIAEARRQAAEQRAALTAARERLAEDPDDEELGLEVERLVDLVGATERTLRRLGDTEAALAAGAAPAGAVRSSGARAVVTVSGASVGGASADVVDVDGRPVQRRAPAIIARRGDPIPRADLIVRAALLSYESFITRRPIEECLAARYPNDEETRAVTNTFTRAAVEPAMTNVPGWAAELVRDSFSGYMDLIARKSVVPNLPLFRQDFDGYSKITFPRRVRDPNANLAAAFRREGEPIRVGRISLTSAELTPKSMGVISTFTKELLKRSTPSIEAVVRQAMVQDTAEALDAIFLGDDAGVPGLRPAGITYGVAAPNTAPSTGSTPDKVLADVKARVLQMTDSGYGDEAAWVMHTSHWKSIQMMQNAVGGPAFPESANGMLAGYPVRDSLNVEKGVVVLLDGAVIPFAGGAPTFEGSDQATLHMEDANPLPIVSGPQATPVAASPTRSLWQTNSQGIKSVWEVDWTVATDPNDGAVQTITGVAW